MGRLLRSIVIAAAICAASATAAQSEDSRIIAREDLPHCWTFMSTSTATSQEVSALSETLNATVGAIDSLYVYAGSVPLRVTALGCASPDAARAVAAALDDGNETIVHEQTVYRFVCESRVHLAKMKDLLDIAPRTTRTWKVEMEVAPVYRSDDRYWTEMANALAANHRDPEDEDAILRALELAPRFSFTNELSLPTPRTPWGTPTYSFSMEPVSSETNRDVLTIKLPKLPRAVDVPRVSVNANITTRAFSTWQPDYQPDLYRLTLKTDPWPCTHEEITGWLQYIVDETWSHRRMVDEILCAVYFNIDLDPKSRGVRNGTLATLRQGYGHAWDKSDVFISMCRFMEIPTRQVYGWLHGSGSHVWAQVYFRDENTWVDVDPVYGIIGVSEDYVPLFWSDIGHPPFVFTDTPKITMVSETD
jgi:transglutaminase-like putative cysteine protease